MTPRTDSLEIERRIAARPETVFSFFVDPARYRRWQGIDAELDPRHTSEAAEVLGRSRHVRIPVARAEQREGAEESRLDEHDDPVTG